MYAAILLIAPLSIGADKPAGTVDYTPGIRKAAKVSYCPGRASSGVDVWQPHKLPTTTAAASYRQPIGHTHTCPNCGTSWDHAANPTHQCQVCGTYQYAIDPVSRPIRIAPQTSYVAPGSTIFSQTGQYTFSGGIVAPAQSYATGCSAAGCSNGGFSAPGLFRGRFRR
jgi:hypothetical protein